jgi:hypothetical protein
MLHGIQWFNSRTSLKMMSTIIQSVMSSFLQTRSHRLSDMWCFVVRVVQCILNSRSSYKTNITVKFTIIVQSSKYLDIKLLYIMFIKARSIQRLQNLKNENFS